MKKLLSILVAFMLIIGCYGAKAATENTAQLLVPKPVSLVEKGGKPFTFTQSTTYGFESTGDTAIDAQLDKIGRIFGERVEPAFGYNIKRGGSKKGVVFIIDPLMSNPEGYRLDVTGNKIVISASAPAGIFYGTQTLYQLLPLEAKSLEKVEGVKWTVPQVAIEDAPRFAWRGILRDVVRHYFTLDQLRRQVDQMSEYKYNKMHLHLTDDQGWRIEIKAMPELTGPRIAFRPARVGQFWTLSDPREDEPFDYGGYYTQEEMREFIQYAADRYVEIVPEIDVPGHSLALMTAHPELHCFGTTTPFVNIGNKENLENSSLCIANPETMETLKVIYGEIAELFPSKYMHMGGDEAEKTGWGRCSKCKALMEKEGIKDLDGLQSYFTHEMDEFITNDLNKYMIGWDEILEGGVSPNAIVMSWRGMQGGIDAAAAGHKVIMTPGDHCYVDLYQGDPAIEPWTYGSTPLRNTYEWDPVPEGLSPEYILGGQANLWAEDLTTQRMAEYMMYPRTWALAEVYWTPQESHEWNDVFPRLEYQMKRADAAEINYAVSAYNAWVKPYTSKKDGKIYIDFYKDLDDVEIYYTLDNTIPDNFSTKYDGVPFTIDGLDVARINVQTYRDGKPAGKLFRVTRSEIEGRAKRDIRN